MEGVAPHLLLQVPARPLLLGVLGWWGASPLPLLLQLELQLHLQLLLQAQGALRQQLLMLPVVLLEGGVQNVCKVVRLVQHHRALVLPRARHVHRELKHMLRGAHQDEQGGFAWQDLAFKHVQGIIG